MSTSDSYDDARIKILDAELDEEDEIVAQFNPTEVDIEKSVTYAEQEIPGLNAPLQQFVHGDAERLSVELFFDVYEPRAEDQPDDVRVLTDRINRLALVDGDLHAPPVVQFAWGTITFRGVIQNADTTFTLFSGDGVPVRARVNVTFQEYTPPSEQLAEEPRHSADRLSVHRVRPGDTLPGIAGKEYGDPTAWRLIADENELVNPRDLEPGEELVIPVKERA